MGTLDRLFVMFARPLRGRWRFGNQGHDAWNIGESGGAYEQGVFRFGGLSVRKNLRIRAADIVGVEDFRRNRLFFLQFSPGQSGNGIAFRALDL